MFGIGKKSVPLLQREGILTIGDVADPVNERAIMRILGPHAYTMISHARGIGSNKLSYTTTSRSISQSTTLDEDVEEYQEMAVTLRTLARRLARRAAQEEVKGRLISVSIRYSDFRNAVRSTTLDHYVNDEKTIYEHALYLFDRNYSGEPVRHLGIHLGSLKDRRHMIHQLSMFEEQQAPNTIDEVLEQLNARLPGAHLIRASEAADKSKQG